MFRGIILGDINNGGNVHRWQPSIGVVVEGGSTAPTVKSNHFLNFTILLLDLSLARPPSPPVEIASTLPETSVRCIYEDDPPKLQNKFEIKLLLRNYSKIKRGSLFRIFSRIVTLEKKRKERLTYEWNLFRETFNEMLYLLWYNCKEEGDRSYKIARSKTFLFYFLFFSFFFLSPLWSS